jgi:hypothetical protein
MMHNRHGGAFYGALSQYVAGALTQRKPDTIGKLKIEMKSIGKSTAVKKGTESGKVCKD